MSDDTQSCHLKLLRRTVEGWIRVQPGIAGLYLDLNWIIGLPETRIKVDY
jgi:hypothetical protein